jgi:hypothetical protein
MANNRLQIYCKKCLEMATFAKYYPYGWYCNSAEATGILVNLFLEGHSNCWKAEEVGKNEGAEMFGFRTENDEEKDGYGSDYSKKPFKLFTIKP